MPLVCAVNPGPECAQDSFVSLIGLEQSNAFDLDGTGDAGFLGTLQIAYDKQWGNWVAGAFADADWSNIEANFSDSSNTALTLFGGLGGPTFDILSSEATANIETDWGFTIGGRLGYLVTPRTLIYGLVGYTKLYLDDPQVMFEIADPLGGLISPIDSPTKLTAELPDDLDGLTLGAGGEVMLSLSWSLKGEYRFTHLDGGKVKVSKFKEQCCIDIGGGAGIARQIDEQAFADLDVDIHSVRAVLSYKFGGAY